MIPLGEATLRFDRDPTGRFGLEIRVERWVAELSAGLCPPVSASRIIHDALTETPATPYLVAGAPSLRKRFIVKGGFFTKSRP